MLSRKDVLKLNIPKKDNDFCRLYPGEPSKRLINVPQNILWFEGLFRFFQRQKIQNRYQG